MGTAVEDRFHPDRGERPPNLFEEGRSREPQEPDVITALHHVLDQVRRVPKVMPGVPMEVVIEQEDPQRALQPQGDVGDHPGHPT